MKKILFNRIGSIVLALIMVITLISPITAYAKTSTPTMDEIGYENTVFANGTAITIEAGTNGTTSIWYMNGSTKTYLAQNKDLSGYTIYGGFSGYNTYNNDTSTSITMTGGKVANIFLAGRNVKMYGETNFNMSGGTVSGWVYGGGSGYAYLHNGKNYNADVNITMTGGYVANMCGGNEENGGAYYIYGNVYISVIGGTVDNLEVGRWRPGYEILVVEDAHAFIGSDATVNQFGSYDGILYYDRATGAWTTDGEAVPYIPTGATVTIDRGETITFANGLTNNGTIVNNGTIILDAPLQGNAITGNGTIERRTAYITTSEAVSSLEVYINGEKTTNYTYEVTEDKVYLWLSEGTITAVLNGTKYSGTYTKFVASELKNFVPVESITIEPITVNANTKTGLTVKVTPENATYQDVILTVADDSGAKIAGHSITTVQGGKTELTAAVKYGKDGIEDFTSSHTITSSYTAVSNITLSLTEMANGNSKYLDNYCKVEPANASYQDIQWSVVSGSANLYSSTRLQPTRTGTLVVRATIKNGVAYGTDYTKDFNINVPYIAVTGINGTVPETMIINGKVELPTGVTPANASYKNIKWSIVSGADATNASISNGVLTATKTGDITLRATVENGSAEGTSYTKEYNITVYIPEKADISNGNIEIIKEDADNNRVKYSGFEGGYKIVPKTETIDITGTLEASELNKLYNITIDGTSANINLKDLEVKYKYGGYPYPNFDGIIDLKNNANVVMNLEGDNSLYSKEPSEAIIHVPGGSTLTIKSENNGSLVAEYGGNSGRGAIIGGADEGTTGTIKIESGTITGTYAGGIDGAIIGSGENGSGGIVEITGGTIHVTAGDGAAIGSGKSATTGTNVIISGGVVNATNNGYGAAIGGGDSAACGDITITGGSITAKCPDAPGAYRPGAGIGAGQNASPIGTITISGGTIDAYSLFGCGIGKAAAVNSTVNVVIQGGNIKGSSTYMSAIAGDSITDGNGNEVSLVTLTIDGANHTPVESVQPSITYGLHDVYTLDTDKLYFYLPANTNITSVTADGDVYTYRETTGTYRTTISVDITGISPENAIYDEKQHIGYTGTITSGDYTGNYEIMYTGRNTTEYNSTEAPKNIGDYTVTIAVPADNEDYKGSVSIDFSIEEYSANDAVANTTEWTSNAFITAPEGHYISTSNADNGFDSKMTKLMIDTESASASGTVITYYLKNIEKGYITTTPKQITVKVDTHAPSFSEDGAGITITNGNTWWQNLLEFFGFKYYNNKELTFQANDPLSGVSKIYFYIDETDDTTAKTPEQLDALDESVWKSVENGQSYTLSGDTHYVVYAYAVDNADNRSNYISSDGIIIDTVSPSVSYRVTDITPTTAKITLTATDSGSGIASYELINIEEIVSPSSSIEIEEISAGVFLVSNLFPNREYQFGYKVVDNAGNSTQNSGDYISNPIQFAVEKGIGIASVTLDDWTYGEAAKTPVIASDTNTTTEYTFVYESTDGRGYYSTTSAPTDAGKYKVTVTLPENDLYKKVVVSDTFEINTRALNITSIKIKDKMYDGNTNAQIESITTDVLDADKDEIVVTVDNPQFSTKDVDDNITVDINEKDIQLSGERLFNYHLGTLPEKPYYGNIKQRPITIIPDAGQNKVYGDKDPAFTYTVGGDYGLVDGETLKGSLLKEAGESVGFLGYDINDLRTNNRNYSMTLDTTNKFEITKATLTITAQSYTVSEGVALPVFSYKQEGLKFDDQITTTPTYACDATDTSVLGEYAITPSDIQINSGTATNQYTIIYVSGVLTVENNWNPEMDTEYTVNSTEWLNTEFVVTPKEGYVIGANKVDWVTELKGTTEGEENQLSFYVKNIETGAISLQEVATYKLDKNTETTGTTGKVSFDERNGWEAFLNTITFGLFYKDEVTVKVEATDALSGVESIEYFAFESTDGTALTLEQVQAITDWTEMPDDGAPVTVEDTKQFVYYIRITDKAGNVTYLSTDGAEYDTTAPTIDGVKPDTTYYTTQSVKVEDKNLKSVTVNGEEVDDLTKALVLEGNKEATYEIIAIDKAGNKTTVKVTMKKLASQSTQIEDTTPDNVKTDDKQKIEDIKKELEAIDTTNATDAEKEEIKKQIAKCDELLKKIEELKKEANSPKTGDYHNLWMLFALLFVSGMSIMGITTYEKKRRF